MTINQKLDAVLSCLSEAYDSAHTIIKTDLGDGNTMWVAGFGGNQHQLTLLELLIQLQIHYEYSNQKGELEHIIQFLAKNEMIQLTRLDMHQKYFITFQGKFLIENGGYTHKQETEEEEKKFFKSIAVQNNQNAKRLNTLTLVLAVGTIALFLATCIEKFHLLGSIQLWTSLMLFLMGVIFCAVIIKLVEK